MAYYVVEDRVYPCYVFEATGEESKAKLDNDLGKIKTELQKAARAVDASLVVSLEHMQQHLAAAVAQQHMAAAVAADALWRHPLARLRPMLCGGIRSRDCRVHQEE